MPGDAQGTSVPLSLFGGMVTEIAPAVLPEGTSPDCQDVTFLLGSVQQRPCASRIFASPFPGNPTVTYQKTFVQPNENPLNLFIDSANNLWKEDVVNAPGVAALIQTLPAVISQAQSATAFGREYIACSDGFHGSHVPLQYDGTYLDRVTQDGPGAPPLAYDEAASYTIAASGVPGLQVLNQAYEAINSGSQASFTVSLVFSSIPAGYAIGDMIRVVSLAAAPGPYDGVYTISNIVGSTVSYISLQSGGAPFSSGYVCFMHGNTITSGSEAGAVLTLNLATIPVNVNVGDGVVVASLPSSGGAAQFGEFCNVISVNGTQVQVGPCNPGILPIAGGTYQVQFPRFEVVTTVNNIFSVGLTALISGTAGGAPGGYNGSWRVVHIVNATTFDCAFNSAIVLNSSSDAIGGGSVAIAGSSSQGTHQAVVMFLTRQGYITKPSPSFTWNSAGGVRTVFNNLPIGPSNAVARILALTGAGGDNFFYIPTTTFVSGGFGQPSLTIFSTVINDNVTTSATNDFSDNALFAATAIDIQGRDYFAQVVLGEVLGFFPYASRLFAWGERNKLQNLVNMGFEGGYISGNLLTPLGWTVTTDGGTLAVGGPWEGGLTWQVTYNTPGTVGQIQQSAYQDSLGVAILAPSTLYSLRLWCECNFPSSGIAIVGNLYSPSMGLLATLSLPSTSIPPNGGFVTVQFSAATPAVIPADTVLQVGVYSATIVVVGGATFTLDEMQIIPTLQPYRDALFRASYVNAPEQFDGVTGVLGSTNDPSAIQNCLQLRNTMYFNTLDGKHSTSDNGFGEPSSWNVPEVSQAVGCVSVHGTDPGKAGTGESGEEWEFKISRGGLYIFAGGEEIKISQEIQSPTQNGMPGWDSINQNAWETAWLKNDTVNRRLYIGVPIGAATAPTILFVLDYRELNSAAAIASNAPYRESFSGRMIAKEFCRKWTRWNLAANCGEILARPGNVYEFAIGNGNGEQSLVTPGFGNSYTFSSTKYTDDDYGQVTPYYTTYFFVSRDQEQQLGLDCHRKLASYLSAFVSGIGSTSITPYSSSLTNAFSALPAYPLNLLPNHDFEWDLWVTGERIALKIGSIPFAGQTDNAFDLQHLAITLKKEPWAPLRGAL